MLINNAPPLLLHPPQTIIKQCDDCACAEAQFMLFEGETEQNSKLFKRPDESYHSELNGNFHLVFSPHSPSGPCVLNATAWQRYLSFSNYPRLLSEKIDYDLAAQKLIVPCDYQYSSPVPDKSQLSVWLHVTNACNLDCTYCYVKKSSESMSEFTGLKSIRFLFETAEKQGFQRLRLKYAGGEAFLNFKLIQKLQAYAQKLSGQTGIELDSVVLSNGVAITAEFAQWLKDNDTKLMISVDGIGEANDRQRPDRKGKGTFQRITKTIDEILLPFGIKPDISITVTSLNAEGISDIVNWVLERDLPFNLNFYRQPDLKTPHELALEEEKIINGMLEAYQTIRNKLPERFILNGLLDKVQTPLHTHTCGVGKNYIVITHTGQFAQCQMHLQQPLNLPSSPKTIIPLLDKHIIRNLPVDEKAGCQTCTYRYRCTGGCPSETFRVTGRYDVKSPHCNIYKTIYPHALELEGLRLLKVHGFQLQ